MFRIAIFVMVSAVVLQHLGLVEAIAKVISKIAKCHICVSFWSTLVALLSLFHCDIVHAVLLSALMAYLSNFMVFILIGGQSLYNVIDKWLRRKKQRK
jgi:hypothetical protein